MSLKLDAALQPAVEGFMNLENEDGVHISCLNTVVLQVHRNVKFEKLVIDMGPYLTSTDDKIRARGTQLLTEVLTRLPDLQLSPQSLRHFVEFFCARASGDHASVGFSLKSLRALFANHSKRILEGDASRCLKTLLTELNIPRLSQSVRQESYELILLLLSTEQYLAEAREMGSLLVSGWVASMEGEKDPRCLLRCLQISRLIITEVEAASQVPSLLQGLFDVTACYYPITFTPPPNDPHRIRPEDLTLALREVFASSPRMAPLVLPFLIEEKLSSTVSKEAKIDALKTLVHCIPHYRVPAILRHLSSLAATLQDEVMKGPNGEVVDEALECVKNVSTHVALHTEITRNREAWNAFIQPLLDAAVEQLKGTPDSLLARTSGRILQAIAVDSSFAFAAVLQKAVPLLFAHFHGTNNKAQREAVLGQLVSFINTIDRKVDQSISPPMKPYADELWGILSTILSMSTVGEKRRLATEGLCHLTIFPPSPLIDRSRVQQSINQITGAILNDTDAKVRREGLISLGLIADKRSEYEQDAVTVALPQLINAIDDPESSSLSPITSAALGRLGEPEKEESAVNHHSATQTVPRAAKEALTAITHLASRAPIFKQAIVALLQRALVLPPGSESAGGSGAAASKEDRGVVFALQNIPHTTAILGAIAMMIETNKSDQDCMNHCVASGDAASVVSDVDEKSKKDPMDISSLLAAPVSALSVTPPPPSVLSDPCTEQTPIVKLLFHAIKSSAKNSVLMTPGILKSCSDLLQTISQSVSPAVQQLLIAQTVELFLPESDEDNSTATSGDVFRPLSRLSPASHLQFASLFSAIVSSAKDIMAMKRRDEVIYALIDLTKCCPEEMSDDSDHVVVVKEAASRAAAQCLSSIVNKLEADEKLDKLVGSLLADSQASVLNQKLCIPSRLAAVSTYAWIAKALVVRGHSLRERVMTTLFEMLKAEDECQSHTNNDPALTPTRTEPEKDHSSPRVMSPREQEIRIALGHAYGTIMSQGNILSKASGARVFSLYRQWVYSEVFSHLCKALDATQKQMRIPYLIALNHIIANVPKIVIVAEIRKILPLLIQAMLSSDIELKHSSLSTFRVFLHDALDTVRPFMSTLVPLLLQLAASAPKATDRITALQCLRDINRFPSHEIQKYRRQVTQGLLPVLDDRKKVVRHCAVLVRNEWFV